MKIYLRSIFSFFIILLFFVPVTAQKKPKEVHQFKMLYQVKATSVKSQGITGTCWDFSTSSFLESEMIRMGKKPFNISEMYIDRMVYPLKAERYIRYHGQTNFDEGGQAHDVLYIIKKYGMVPEKVYPGKLVDPKKYNNLELQSVLTGMLNSVLHSHSKTISGRWLKAVNAVLNVYLGTPPKEFTYNGKKYTPKSFAEASGLNLNNYVEITSYTHHPFYTKFKLEVPDNWTDSKYYNVPIDKLIDIIDYSLKNGYSVVWDGGDKPNQFYRKRGYAVVPVNEKQSKDITQPEKEKVVTQAIRQKSYDDFGTTDDHLMQITGLAKDQKGTKFYYTKNSWGTKGKVYGGYWYMSEPYVRLNTIAIMVNKNAIPQDLRKKLRIN